MIRKLTDKDIEYIVKIHKAELSGFLSELGEGFLRRFYKASLDIPELVTYVDIEDEQILGFVSIATATKGLYKKIIFKHVLGFGLLFLSYFIVHPRQITKMINILTYPGFKKDSPELLTISVDKKEQGKGIGKKLFNRAIVEFKKRGIYKFKISVYDRLPANKFYLRIGCRFEKTFDFLGERMNYYIYKISR